MKKFLLNLIFLLVLFFPVITFAAGRIQNEDVKSATDLTNAGGSISQLINDSKIYVTANGINEQLSSAITGGLIGGSSTTGTSYAVNGKVNIGITGWTANGGTSTVSQSSVNLGGSGNTNSALFTSSGATDYLLAQAVTLPTGLNNCMIDFYYQTSSSAYSANIYYGSNLVNTIALPAAASFTHVNLPFICSSVASNYSVQWTGGAAASTLYVTNYYIGQNLNIGTVAQAQLVGTITYTNGSCDWSKASATMADFPAHSACTYTTTGGVTAIAGILPGVNITNPQAGTYLIVINGTFYNSSGNSTSTFSFYDGTNYWGQGACGVGSATQSICPGFTAVATYTTAPSSLYFKLQTANNNSTGSEYNSFNNNAQISVYLFPSASQQVITPSTSAAYWSGYFDTAAQWTTTSTSFVDPTVTGTSNLVTRNSNNLTVTKAASNLPGIIFTPPHAGQYWICMNYQAEEDTQGHSGLFQMTDGTNILNSSGMLYVSSGGNIETMQTLCGIENTSSTSPITVKLQLRTTSGGTVLINNNYVNPIEISIIDITQNLPMPQIVNSVVTNYSGQTSIAAANIFGSTFGSNCTSSPCTIYNQIGSAITSVTRSTNGNYTVNFAAGTFNQSPVCKCTTDAASYSNCASLSTSANNTSSINIYTYTSSAYIDSTFSIDCIGTKN